MAVMVIQVNMTPFARQCLQEMAPKYYIEVVSNIKSLQVIIADNPVLTDTHIAVSICS